MSAQVLSDDVLSKGYMFAVMDAAGIPIGLVDARTTRSLVSSGRVKSFRSISRDMLDKTAIQAERNELKSKKRSHVAHTQKNAVHGLIFCKRMPIAV